MKLTLIPLAFLLAASLGAAEAGAGEEAKPYTLATCIVKGKQLNPAKAKVLVVEGQQFKVCCGGCVKKVKADPAGYVAKLEEAVAAQGEGE